jgi:DNA-binding LytR/AlgR family response regulator
MKEQITSRLPFRLNFNLRDRLNSPFPYYLNDDRKNLIVITIISVFVIVFMTVYEPQRNFSENLTFANICVFGGITFLILSISMILLPKIFTRAFDPTNWTLGKYLAQTLAHCLAIGFLSVLVDAFYICPYKTLEDIIVHDYTQVALIGIIPVTFMTLFLKNNMLQENLREAIKANQELEKIRNLKNEISTQTHHAITLYSDTSETLQLNLRDLLFIEADDNYSTVFWIENSAIQKKLLRINLKNIEGQINNSFTIRCHRSYMVNVHAISSVTGNTNGYKLRIRDTEHYIPVSRPKGKEVMEKIQQLKNVMELY